MGTDECDVLTISKLWCNMNPVRTIAKLSVAIAQHVGVCVPESDQDDKDGGAPHPDHDPCYRSRGESGALCRFAI